LAVEKSKVTGLIVRPDQKKISTTACVSRWKISVLPSETLDNLPGIGYPKWKVELLRVKNGKAGSWEVQWSNGEFIVTPLQVESNAHNVSSKLINGNTISMDENWFTDPKLLDEYLKRKAG
jgi:protein ImuA